MFYIDKVLVLKDVDSIYKSLSDILGVNEITIKRFIARKSMFYRKLEDVSLDVFFAKVFDAQIEKEDLYNRIKFDWVTMSHFSSRLDDINIEKQPLYNLFDALINDTDISLYMRENGFNFIREENSILTFYKGEKINWEDYFKIGVSRDSSNPKRVQARLVKGYQGINDKCVNGFLFGENLNKNNYVKTVLLGCPEIISDICGVLNRKDMIKYIKDNSYNYVITFKEKISNVMFINDIHLYNKSKLLKIYKYVIFYLCKKDRNTWDENTHNQMLRLKDELSVPSENIIEAKKINIKW